MSNQNAEVFRHCVGVAKELFAEKRREEAVAIARALQVYLEYLPATSDGSCRGTVSKMLDTMGSAMRESQRKLPKS